MKSLKLQLCFLIFASQLFSQNEISSSRFAAKIYNMSSFGQYYQTSGDTSVYGIKAIGNGMSFIHPTFAVQLKGKKKNYHELELINLYRIKSPVFMFQFLDSTQTNLVEKEGGQRTASYVSFRYEYTMSFKSEEDAKVEFCLGFGINPYFSSRKFESFVPTIFNNSQRSIGFRSYVIPRINYFFNPKYFVDLNLPIAVTDFVFTSAHNANPVIPEQQQIISNFNFQTLLKVITCRVGLGLRF